jgi:SH3-like domain-containing protein
MNVRIGRLLVLGLVLLALVSGCGEEPSPGTPTTTSATPTVTASPTKTPTVTPTPKPSPTAVSVKKYVTDDEVRFRASPSTDAEIFQTLMKGTEVQFLQVEGEWTKVSFEGQTGYIFSIYLSGTAPTP